MTQERLTLGQQGEELAAQFLVGQGMKIVGRNVRTPVGEIDIIARSRKVLAFVEVKTRRVTVCGSPAEAVGPRKQRQIIRAAQWYLNDQKHDSLQPRFDVIAVQVAVKPPVIDHIVDAFGV